MTTEWQLRTGSAADLDLVGPLWVAVHHQHAVGVKDLILGALPGNTDAIRLYERRGYQPTWLYLSRFEGR